MDNYDDILSELRGGDDDDQSDDDSLASLSADSSDDDLFASLAGEVVGEQVALEILRGGQKQEIKVTIGERK